MRGLRAGMLALAGAVAVAGCGSTLVPSPGGTGAPSAASGAGGPSGTTASAGAGTPPGTGTSAPAGTGTSPGTGTSAGRGSGGAGAPRRDGLLPALGYSSYELCQGTCTGSVPAGLRRPLRIPNADGGPCPISLSADGPVSPTPGPVVGARTFTGSRWAGAEVTWKARPSYAGPILIRGRELGSSTPVGFGRGVHPFDELQLLDSGRGAPRVTGGGRAWLSYTRVPGPGCYAYQVDGIGFTEVFVFRAAG